MARTVLQQVLNRLAAERDNVLLAVERVDDKPLVERVVDKQPLEQVQGLYNEQLVMPLSVEQP
jgi:hypothetical protein